MKQLSILTIALGGVLCCTVSRADITSISSDILIWAGIKLNPLGDK
jgi:hypothetical protein